MKTSGDVHTQQPSVEYGPDQVQFGAPSLWPEPLFRQIELGHAITLTKKKGVHFVISTVKSSILRLSALVILYFHYLKGIFCHSHQNSLLYTQFLRARSSPISLLYPNYQELDPRVRIIFFLPHSLLPPSLLSLCLPHLPAHITAPSPPPSPGGAAPSSSFLPRRAAPPSPPPSHGGAARSRSKPADGRVKPPPSPAPSLPSSPALRRAAPLQHGGGACTARARRARGDRALLPPRRPRAAAVDPPLP